MVSSISQLRVHPDKDLTRNKKFPANRLISFLVSEVSSSTKIDLRDFFEIDTIRPTDPAFNQQQTKLKLEALETV